MNSELPPVSELPSGPGRGGVTNIGLYASRHPGPCAQYNCPMQSRCKEKQLACKAFATFINSARLREPDPESANRARYILIFESED